MNEEVDRDDVDMSKLDMPLEPKPKPIPPRWYQILVDAGEQEIAEELLKKNRRGRFNSVR